MSFLKMAYSYKGWLNHLHSEQYSLDPGKIPGESIRIITEFDGRDGWRALEKTLILNVLKCYPVLTRKADWYPGYNVIAHYHENKWLTEHVFDKKRLFPFNTNYLRRLMNEYVRRLMAVAPLARYDFKLQHFDLLKSLYRREIYYGFHSEEESLEIKDFDIVGNLSELYPERVGKPSPYAESLRIFLAKDGWELIRGNKPIVMMG